ncbi:MAG: serine/threonine protein kinase [Conexibacteraceae bacterium]|nr:serine/threonine protein kinase [Conexibacteraceae bacterium]
MEDRLRSVGRYELLEVIGRGGAAVVYLAHQPDLDRQVALKELAPHHAGDPSFAQRFVEESRLAGAMSHPSIVTVHEYFEHDGIPYIAMEYLPRGSLRPYLADLTLAQIAGLLEDVLAGLAHGESRGIIHRDLKPENLLVAADGHVKIADFGVARALGNAAPRAFVTVTGTTIGTPAYMAPEQALGEPLSPATDLYSLGIIIWEALAGHTPFGSHDTPMAVLYKHVHDPAPPIDTVRDGVAPELSAWLSRLLAKRPADRFPSATAAWEEIEDVMIDLLGPRWRRDARITGDPAPAPAARTTPVTQTLSGSPQAGQTPSAGEGADASEMRRAQSLAVSTPPSAQAPAPAGSDTLLRAPRRHAGAAAPAPQAPASTRRRARPLLVAAAVAGIAAIAGGAVGGLTAGATTKTRTTTTPAVAFASSVRPIMGTLATAQHAGMTKLDAAHKEKAQAAAARALAADYGTAQRSVHALPRTQAALPAARTLDTALARMDQEWRSLAAAASRGSRSDYSAASAALGPGASRLERAVLAAERARG